MFLPCEIAKDCNECKNNILKTGKSKSFIKIKRRRNNISNDPVYPIFNLTLCHKPHSYKENSSSNSIYVSGPTIPFIKSLINNKYDAVVASMSITEERLEIIDFTDPYYSNFLSIVGKTSAGLTLADLDTRFIGAQRSTIGAQWVEDRFGNPGSAYQFDGVNDYIAIAPSSLVDNETTVTLSFWLKREASDEYGLPIHCGNQGRYGVHVSKDSVRVNVTTNSNFDGSAPTEFKTIRSILTRNNGHTLF